MSDSSFDSGSSGPSVITTRTSQSWFGRIIGGVQGVVFGLVLVLASGVLMFWNEGRSAKTAAALAEGASIVQSISADSVNGALEGKLIHIAGGTSADKPAVDSDFGLNAQGLKLDRKVEMFQWKEESHSETQKKLGGGEETITRYTYTKDWSDQGVESQKFHDGSTHRNPPMPQVKSRVFFAQDAKIGAFGLGRDVLDLLDASEPASAPDEVLGRARSLLGARAMVAQGGVFAGANPDSPAVGDIRVTWKAVPLTDVSVIGRQTQSKITPYVARNGNELLLAEIGTIDAKLMFKHGAEENSFLTWVLRLVGFVMMFIGFSAMLSLFGVLADVIPFLGNLVGAGTSLLALLFTLVLAPVIMAIAWIVYRPLVGIAILVVGGAIAYGLHVLARSRAAARRPA